MPVAGASAVPKIGIRSTEDTACFPTSAILWPTLATSPVIFFPTRATEWIPDATFLPILDAKSNSPIFYI